MKRKAQKCSHTHELSIKLNYNHFKFYHPLAQTEFSFITSRVRSLALTLLILASHLSTQDTDTRCCPAYRKRTGFLQKNCSTYMKPSPFLFLPTLNSHLTLEKVKSDKPQYYQKYFKKRRDQNSRTDRHSDCFVCGISLTAVQTGKISRFLKKKKYYYLHNDSTSGVLRRKISLKQKPGTKFEPGQRTIPQSNGLSLIFLLKHVRSKSQFQTMSYRKERGF